MAKSQKIPKGGNQNKRQHNGQKLEDTKEVIRITDNTMAKRQKIPKR